MIRSGSSLSGFRLLFPGAAANVFVEARVMKHKDLVDAMGANKRAELYFAEHPGSPAAVRRPQLSIRSGTWVAVLGPNVQDGIVGMGATVETALRAFDYQYLAALRPPGERHAF